MIYWIIKWIYLWSPTEGKQFHLFLALQHTTAGLLQYGGGSYQSRLVEEADGCLNLCTKLFTVQAQALYSAGARSKNSATNHSTFQKKSELFSIGGGHVVPVVNNTTCFSKYKWLLFLLLFSSYFPLLSHSFLK